MTREFIRNNYRNFKIMWDDYFSALGISAFNSGNCGMHVNVSLGCFGDAKTTQDLAIRKLYYIINKHYRVMARMLYRNLARTTYCRQMDASQAKTMDLEHMSGSHGNCLNYSHYNVGRIEIRLVGGQKNYASFRNTMETVFFLVDRVKTLSWKDCDSLEEIFRGCNNYVVDRAQMCVNESVLDDETFRAIKANSVYTEYL